VEQPRDEPDWVVLSAMGCSSLFPHVGSALQILGAGVIKTPDIGFLVRAEIALSVRTSELL
jgi:hypothetical protein